jgi:hypothetical protein
MFSRTMSAGDAVSTHLDFTAILVGGDYFYLRFTDAESDMQ